MPANKYKPMLLGVFSVILLSACMSKEAGYSDQQKRMLRCDQYLGETREECLRGTAVTIEDYKTDYREFERSEKKKSEEKDSKLKKDAPVIILEPPVSDEQP